MRSKKRNGTAILRAQVNRCEEWLDEKRKMDNFLTKSARHKRKRIEEKKSVFSFETLLCWSARSWDHESERKKKVVRLKVYRHMAMHREHEFQNGLCVRPADRVSSDASVVTRKRRSFNLIDSAMGNGFGCFMMWNSSQISLLLYVLCSRVGASYHFLRH